jgi:hypothetical protein
LFQPSPALNAAMSKPKPCQRMPANGFMIVKAVACCSNQSLVTVVSFALMPMCLAHRYKKA